MKNVRALFLMLALGSMTIVAGCSGEPTGAPNTNARPATNSNAQPGANANSAPTPQRSAVAGTITANPSTIKVCDKSGTGETTLSWEAQGGTVVEVRIGSPDGQLFAQTGNKGSKKTGKWVGNGMVFYLQDVTGNKPRTAEHTIATVTVNVTSEGCP